MKNLWQVVWILADSVLLRSVAVGADPAPHVCANGAITLSSTRTRARVERRLQLYVVDRQEETSRMCCLLTSTTSTGVSRTNRSPRLIYQDPTLAWSTKLIPSQIQIAVSMCRVCSRILPRLALMRVRARSGLLHSLKSTKVRPLIRQKMRRF